MQRDTWAAKQLPLPGKRARQSARLRLREAKCTKLLGLPCPLPLGPLATSYTRPLPSCGRVPDLSRLGFCRGVESHPSSREVISPSRTLPPRLLKQQDPDRRDAFSTGHRCCPGLGSCVGSPRIQKSEDRETAGSPL